MPSDASHSTVADNAGTVWSVHDVDTEQPAPRDSAGRRVPRPLVWVLGAIFVVLAFAISMVAFPVIALGLVLVALALFTDLGGMRSRIRRTGVWRSMPWLRGTRPVVAALVLLLWAGTTGVLGFALYKSDHQYHAHIAAVTATAVVHARGTATAVAVAQQTRVAVHAIAAKRIALRGTATAVSVARSHATAQAVARKTQVVAQRTAAVRATATAVSIARSHATAQAVAQRTAGPRETSTAIALAWAAAANATATEAAKPAIDLFPAVKDVLSGNNNDDPSQPKLRNFEYFSDTQHVNVDFNIDQNLTEGLTKDGIKKEMSDIYIAIFHKSSVPVKSAAVAAWGQVQDQYGNTKYAVVYGTKMTSDVAGQINWNADQATLELDIVPGLWDVYWAGIMGR